jgi:glyoxylase-like metal-dependent hydrolase (beta-lactamase superfamily II)
MIINILWFCSVVMSGQSFAADIHDPNFSVQTVAGDGVNGALVNSTFIIGRHEVFLVDTQLTENNAKRVVLAIQKTNKVLTTVFLTHGHPDHILGASTIREAFPKAKFIATESVALDIRRNGEKLRRLFSKIMKDSKSTDQIAATIVVPEIIPSNEIEVDGLKLKVIPLQSGESESAAMIYISESGTLISGDVFYNKVHLWLRDGKFTEWIKNIELVKRISGLKTIYPGHGEKSDLSVIGENINYIENFEKTMSVSSSAEEVVRAMKKIYPHYKMDRNLQFAATHKI